MNLKTFSVISEQITGSGGKKKLPQIDSLEIKMPEFYAEPMKDRKTCSVCQKTAKE